MSTQDPIAGLPPVHPGTFLREIVIPALPQGKAEIARLLGVSRQTLYGLLDATRAITPEMALRLGKLLGNGGEFWLAMQAQYDLRMAREALADALAAIPTLEAAGVQS